MKKTILIFILFPGVLFAQLPKETEILLGKLSDWELNQQAALQKEIKAKRAEVAKALQSQLEKATKSGNLDAALAIKKEIARLSPDTDIPPKAKLHLPRNDKELTEFIRGSRWKFPNGKIMTLREDGQIEKSWGKIDATLGNKGHETSLRDEGALF